VTAGSKHERIGLLLVALLAFGVFAPSIDGDFIYDDIYQIRENDQLRDLRNLPRFFTADVWAAVGLPFSSYYRPLMYTTFAFETVLAGPVPWIYRTTNAVLHAGISVVVVLLLLRLRESRAAAFAAGLLFAVHPMHGEVVAWPSARPELLVTLFALLAAWVYAGSDARSGPTQRRFLAVGACVMGALLSKETGVLAPVLIGLVALQRAEGSARARIEEGIRSAAPFLALVVVFIGLRSLAIRVSALPPLVGDDPLVNPFRTASDAALHVVAIAGRYLGAMLLPIDPSSFHVPRWENVAHGLALVPVGLAAIALAPRSHAASWLTFAFVAIGIQSVGVPSAGYLSQRYAYLPSVGACAFLGIAGAHFLRDAAGVTRRRVGAALLAITVAGWTALLIPRSLEWASEKRLWSKAIERDPDAPAVLANHGYMLLDSGRAEEALEKFQRLETADPGEWAGPYGEGNTLVALGRHEEAIARYEIAIERAPMIPYLYQGLGFAYEDLGDYEKARETYEKALELFPDSSLGKGILSILDAKHGNPIDALRRTEEALALRGDLLDLRLNRVALLAQLGRVDEAFAEAEALTANPRSASDAHAHLGILYDRYRRDPKRAAEHYLEALRLDPDRAGAERIQRRVAVLEREPAPR
jgi:tetratricopeptide (TPR) repeat protein